MLVEREDRTEFYATIARNLPGMKWTVTKRADAESWHDWADIMQNTGAGVRVSIRDGKADIRPEFPRHDDGETAHWVAYNETTPSISVSLSRGPETIAKEIARRLLPQCQEHYERAFKVIEQRRAHKRDQARAMRPFREKLADIPGMKTTENAFSFWELYDAPTKNLGSLKIEIRADGGGSFKIEYTNAGMLADLAEVFLQHHHSATENSPQPTEKTPEELAPEYLADDIDPDGPAKVEAVLSAFDAGEIQTTAELLAVIDADNAGAFPLQIKQDAPRQAALAL